MELSLGFEAAGYPLATTGNCPLPCLIEVYPHPALLSLLERERRVPYKGSKAARYWPGVTAAVRVDSLLREYSAILMALTKVFGPVDINLPSAQDVRAAAHLKRYEDALDALICAWVGVEHLEGRTIALGDESAAIWCPRDVVFSCAGRKKQL
jgi:predicted RNase H-like nuclease